MASVNPEVLAWARKTAGLSEEQAAARIGLGDTKAMNRADRIAALEEGAIEPTRAQLVKMAAAYRRPLVALYMARPPVDAPAIEDYRTLPDREPDGSEGTLKALVRDIRARQEVVRDLLKDLEVPELTWVGSIAQGPVEQATQRIRRILGFELTDFRNQRTPERAFEYCRRLTEAQGCFVLLVGNLGSHHTNLPVDVFRGFALADAQAPFIVINDQDAKVAWSFTLLHELTHIALGATGISAGFGQSQIERFCNQVASALLLPENELEDIRVDDRGIDDLATEIGRFAGTRLISRPLVAYRLYTAGKLTFPQWNELNDTFAAYYRQAKQVATEKQKGAPDYYTVRRHRLGSALLSLIETTMAEGMVTPVRAGKVLGVKPRNVGHLLAERAA